MCLNNGVYKLYNLQSPRLICSSRAFLSFNFGGSDGASPSSALAVLEYVLFSDETDIVSCCPFIMFMGVIGTGGGIGGGGGAWFCCRGGGSGGVLRCKDGGGDGGGGISGVSGDIIGGGGGGGSSESRAVGT